MKTRILDQFSKLSSSEKKQVLAQLQNQLRAQTNYSEHTAQVTKCLHCDSEHFIKFGTYKNTPRYKCKACTKTFSAMTGTAMCYIKRTDLWTDFITLTLDGKSTRQIALKLKVAVSTAFEWRHKLLLACNNIFTKEFVGTVQTDDVYMTFSEKGRKKNKANPITETRGIGQNKVAVMFTADNFGTVGLQVVKRGRIRTVDLNQVYDNRIGKRNIVVSDSHRSIKKYFRDRSIKHHTLHARKKQRVNKDGFHIQRINWMASQFRRFVDYHYSSVSTKYLQSYLNLFMLVSLRASEEKIITYSLSDRNSLERFKTIEQSYQRFRGE